MPVTLEDVRALGPDGAAGYECRVRLPDGGLDEAIISPDEAVAIVRAAALRDSGADAAAPPADPEQLQSPPDRREGGSPSVRKSLR